MVLGYYIYNLIVYKEFSSGYAEKACKNYHAHYVYTRIDVMLMQCNPLTNLSPCHLVPSSRIRPLATAVVAPLHPALSLASRLILLMVALLEYPLSVSSHLCIGLPLFLAPFILPSITSSSIPPALTTCPM